MKEFLNLILEALKIGLESAQSEADDYHHRMAGYRQYHHDAMDNNVNIIKNAITMVELKLKENGE